MLIAALLATQLGVCSLNNSPSVPCVMAWSIEAPTVAIVWEVQGAGRLAVGGTQTSTERFTVEAVQVLDSSPLTPASGECYVRAKSVSCRIVVGGQVNTFIFRE